MDAWTPLELKPDGPRYQAIVDALQQDIEQGRLVPGSKLPPHREMADRLGLSVGTVSKAYSEAELLGLIVGKVGSGTFVRSKPAPGFGPASAIAAGAASGPAAEGARTRQLSLGLNVAPPGHHVEALLAGLAQLNRAELIAGLFDYLPHEGLPAHRAAAARWMSSGGYRPSPDDVLVCHGAQHAASLVTRTLAEAGAPVLAEGLTYSGVKALASYQGLNLVGVPLDREGLIPEALDEACARTGARLLYVMPTLQSPTAATMGERRRAEIAEILERRDLMAIEDNVYGFLDPAAPPPLAALVPHRVFYVTSLSKCVAPGLRVGFLVAPPAFRDRMILGMRATAWMATPAMVEVGVRMLNDGSLEALAAERRAEARARTAIAGRVLASHLAPAMPGGAAGFHVWLKLPPDWPAARFFLAARQRGVSVTPPDAIAVDARSPNGVRLCLGSPASRQELEEALGILRALVESTAPTPLSVV